MCNAATKFIALGLTACLMAACSGTDRREAEAGNLYNQAVTATDAGNYELAAALLDSIDSSCPRAIEVRRDAMYLRTRVQEGLTLHEISATDSAIVALQVRGDSLKHTLQWVSNPVEGYYVGRGAGTDPHGTTGLHARMMPDGTFYIISSLAQGCGHTSVTVSTGGASATTRSVAHDGERNDRSSGTEIITYTPAECDTVGRLIMEHPGARFTLTFNGRKSFTTTLNPAQQRAIADMMTMVETARQLKMQAGRKSVLEQRLNVLRQQQARTVREPAPDTAD